MRASLGLFCMVALPACTQPEVRPPAAPPEPSGSPLGEVRLLAGTWEYEETGQVYTLVLDEWGNGHYDFEDGWFETTALTDRTWRGLWHQKKNDRDGGFEVMLTPDFSRGDGRWWYTRIGTDTTPAKPGGTFILRRVKPDPAP